MPIHDTDGNWARLAASDPYYAVLAEERYHGSALSSRDRAAFFESGEVHIQRLVGVIRTTLDPDFAPGAALDYGCGVGRLVLPLASLAARVVGVDVAPGMLNRARMEAETRQLDNVDFAMADDELSAVSGEFDFVHSFIVFQHIPPERGLRIIHALLQRLADGGIAALHVVYAREMRPLSRALAWVRTNLPLGSAILNLASGRRYDAPAMAMYDYPLPSVLECFRSAGCHRLSLMFSDHGGARGVMIIARKIGEASL